MAASSEPGAARAFPSGRLADFENASDGPVDEAEFLRTVLPKRGTRAPRRAAAAQPAEREQETADPTASSAAVTPAPEAAPAGSDTPSDDAPRPTAQPALLSGPIRTGRPRSTPRRQRRTAEEKAEEKAPEATDSALRASNMHIPADFMPRVKKAQAERRRTNGDLVIAALEETYDQLADLIAAPPPTGGSLFAPRISRSIRNHDSPLTPFNVRLREADFKVIDQLVAQFGARSRGHLITVAFDAFLPTV